jgi:purine-binding chemotaxis protein CheW
MSTRTPADWEKIRAQLNAAQARTEQHFPLSPEEENAILKARAHELAREPATEVEARDLLEIVEFELAGECYGLELARVREVCAVKELTPVPCVPAFVLGIINLRGEIHTVIDLKKFFELPEAGITELNKIILLESGGTQLGILADAIRGVRRLPLAELQPALPTLTDIRADYLRGVTSERLVLLEAAKILSDPRLLVEDRDEPQPADQPRKPL